MKRNQQRLIDAPVAAPFGVKDRLWLCVLVLALARFPSNMFQRSHDTFVPEGLPLVVFSQIDPPVPNVAHMPGLKRKMFLLQLALQLRCHGGFLMPSTRRLHLNIHTLLLCNSAEFCVARGRA